MKKILFILTAMVMSSLTVVSAQQEVCQLSPSTLAASISIKNGTTTRPNGNVNVNYIFVQAARDWHDFHKFHEHVEKAIHEVEIARMAGHYAMAGHGDKTEDFLRLAEKELHLADNSTNNRQ